MAVSRQPPAVRRQPPAVRRVAALRCKLQDVGSFLIPPFPIPPAQRAFFSTLNTQNSMLKKVYVEITNVCNLACPFCRGTTRPPAEMDPADFSTVCAKLRPYTEYIYLHLLGEPLLHTRLGEILDICKAMDFKVTLVTNGTLIEEKASVLPGCGCLYKVCFSLHAYEANEMKMPLEDYLAPILRFAEASAEKGVINVLKLWNGGGAETLNEAILQRIKTHFGAEFTPARGGFSVKNNVYIDIADRFRWPDLGAEETPPRFCMALRDQIGVLADGTAVPCCLDADGTLALGNLKTDSVETILHSERAMRIKEGFSQGKAAEDLCRRCDFAKRKFG